MAPVTNGRVIFNEIPTGYPVPGQTLKYDISATIDLENVPLNGGFLIKTLVLSVDPYMRGKMRDPKVKSYTPAFVLGEPLYGSGIGLVLRSESDKVKAGDHIYGILTHEQYSVQNDVLQLRVLNNTQNLPWSTYLGVLGMPAHTAYMGWREYANPKKGEVVFVSAGAGSVGSLVVQLAKADGLKVIAAAGSDEKVAFLKDIGVDVAFNYKTQDTNEVLAKEGPIDIYWDNVGGSALDAALEGAANGARFIECGMISISSGQPYRLKNYAQIVRKSLHIHGFIVFNLQPKYEEEFNRVIPPQVASGKIKFAEDITKGLENVGEAMLAILTGANTGKSTVWVADD